MRIGMRSGSVIVRVSWFLVVAPAMGCTSADRETSRDAGTAQIQDEDASLPVIFDAGDEPAAPPNGAALCPIGLCNYQTQQGCDSTGGQSCVPSLSGDAGVAPVCIAAGAIQGGGACSGLYDCAVGHVCAGGVCRRLCCGRDWSACPADQRCVTPLGLFGATGAVASGAYMCMPAMGCDVFAAASCAAGTACQIVDPTGATACVAAPAGTIGASPGDPCPCQTGFTCTGGMCRRLCSTSEDGGGPGCPPEEGRCTHWRRDPAGVGECSPLS